MKAKKKHRIREGSIAWYLTNGGGIGIAMVTALYVSVCAIVTLANKGIL